MTKLGGDQKWRYFVVVIDIVVDILFLPAPGGGGHQSGLPVFQAGSGGQQRSRRSLQQFGSAGVEEGERGAGVCVCVCVCV